jgi:hypothetical protein
MKRGWRQQRRRVFLGCEGDSERSYGTFLHQLVASNGRLHIETVVLQPGGGDPLAIVERAVAIIKRKEREFGSAYAVRAILLDQDKFGSNAMRDQRIPALVNVGGIHLIWQRPTHEALLLRHIPGCQTHQPPSAADALARLRGHWPDYSKGMSAAYLAGKITLDHVRGACGVEVELNEFLTKIGYFV